MIDHVFMDAIGALREACEQALLERQAIEERFQVDLLLGDVTWETSYGLPGEGTPPRVRADLTLNWPTWSQTAFRNWYIGEPLGDPPEIAVEVVLRVQELASTPALERILAALPADDPTIGDERLERSGPTVEELYDASLERIGVAVEVTFEGGTTVDESTLENPVELDERFRAMGGWIAATLVRLGDLDLDYLPPGEEPA